MDDRPEESQQVPLVDLSETQPPAPPAFASYQEMCEAALGCTKCSLAQTRTNVVIADGSPQAKLLLIGEGPGEQEDLSGIPFVGKAGQLLSKILEAAGIDRQKETYICNVVKCRPPGNRVPNDEEAAACAEYLRFQLQHVRPAIVLLLGATAVRYVLQIAQPKITKMHGQWLTPKEGLLRGMLVMPFYHPSYLLRNQSKEKGSPKWQAWQAIKEVKAKLDEFSGAT